MFARYLGEAGFGLIPQEIYYINASEELVQGERKLTIIVGDFWANDYSSYGEAMTEWDFTEWQQSGMKLAMMANLPSNRMSSLS